MTAVSACITSGRSGLTETVYRNADKESLSKSCREWYVAPLYNRLIEDGGKVYIHRLAAECVTVLGTPEDLQIAGRKLINYGGDSGNQ